MADEKKVKLTVSGVLADLDAGLNRIAIREKYGLSATDTKRLFQHEKLKGARVKTAPAFELEDDTAEEVEKVKAVATPPKKVVANSSKKSEAQPVVAAQAEEAVVVKEEEEEEKEVVLEEEPSGEVKEVQGEEDDDAEVPEVETKKGLW
jgi:hypothetical protein